MNHTGHKGRTSPRESDGAIPRSQEQRILWLLQSSWPGWTPAPALSRISLQYCRAIRSLRKAGWQIQNKVVIENGKRHGFYRLGSPASCTDSRPKPATAEVSAAPLNDPPTKVKSFPQFGDLAPAPEYPG